MRRWHKDRIIRLVREDLRDLTNIMDIDKVELLAHALIDRVGSPLSMKSLAEDLEVDPKTIKKWIETLDSLYYCFQIAPFGSSKIRAVKKEQKLYLWDWSQIPEAGFRFENMVASQLLKYCHHLEDIEGYQMKLRYIRDTDKREVDFVVIQNKKPLFAVEYKLKEKNLSSHIKYFKERTNIPKFYQVHTDDIEKVITDDITITSFANFCRYENMV